jgi:hypothetical protein
MGGAGKVGGGKGGGPGKGKGKGKKGGGGPSSGQVTMCFDQATLSATLKALNAAVKSSGLGQGCAPGLMIVRMDLGTAQNLFNIVLSGLSSGVSKKKKKKKGKTGTLVIGPVTGKKKKAG